MNTRCKESPASLALWIGILTALLCSGVALAAEVTGMRAGPAVWIEEYWDVKPDQFDRFVAAYRNEVYSISRRVAGYRGYTFMTNLPDEDGHPPAPRDPERMLTPHYGVHLQGETLVKQAIDIGKLLRQTHNVVVAHHLQSWSDAEAFRQNMARTYAEEHDGASYTEHLAETLYPLANNYWETTFRLIETGLKYSEEMHSGGADADGYNLEPHPTATGWFKEYFDITAEDMDAFLNAYKNNTLVVMSPIPGYEGVTLLTTLPPDAEEAARTGYAGQVLGGPAEFYVPQPGVMMGGSVRTDTAINYSALFKPTFTLITYYQFPWGAPMLEPMQANFERDHPGKDRLEHITRVLFPHAQNHWDMHYRAIETSFVPSSATAGDGN